MGPFSPERLFEWVQAMPDKDGKRRVLIIVDYQAMPKNEPLWSNAKWACQTLLKFKKSITGFMIDEFDPSQMEETWPSPVIQDLWETYSALCKMDIKGMGPISAIGKGNNRIEREKAAAALDAANRSGQLGSRERELEMKAQMLEE